MIEILGNRNGTFFPIVKLDLRALLDTGFSDQFMLRYAGQIFQLKVEPEPSECLVSTPQEASPVQDLNSGTGGNPDRTCLNVVEKVTVFFATAHSKVESGMMPPDE